jgi:hypothetical protein
MNVYTTISKHSLKILDWGKSDLPQSSVDSSHQSSLLLKIQTKSTQTLKLFTKIIKTESLSKVTKTPSRRFGFRNQVV